MNTSSFLDKDRRHCEMQNTIALNMVTGLEILCTCWFTLEIVLRLIFSPSKLLFIRTLSNWVDLLAVVPVYLFIFMRESDAIMILNIVRYVRVFRFFKLLYDLHILGKTLQASTNQLVILLIVLCIPVIVFSSLVYYAEYFFGTEESKVYFQDIPTALWWAIITMTTIGSITTVPHSWAGQILGGMAAVIGVILLSLTASVIGSSFQNYYNVARTQMKIPAKRRKIKGVSKATLRSMTTSEKSDSIKSDDSKDSGYGRSPVPHTQPTPPVTSPPHPVTSPPQEKNLIVALEEPEAKRSVFCNEKPQGGRRRCSMLV